MTITTVTPMVATPPDRSQDAATFNTNAAASLAEQKVLGNELVVSIPEMNTDIAQANADAASAAASAATAAANGNYLGAWSSQTGAQTVPASVSHLGSTWRLTSDIADIALKVPGTDSEWERLYIATPEQAHATALYF